MILMKTRRKSFVLYGDLEPTLLHLSENEMGVLFFMVYSYVNRGVIDSYRKRTPKVDLVFSMIRTHLDRDREKYERICERNAKNGKLGGRPKSNSETQNNRSVFKKPDNDIDIDNDIDNDIDIDTDNEFGFDSGRSYDLKEFFEAALKRAYEKDKK